MSLRDKSIYSALDIRRYVAPEDMQLIYETSNAKYNGKGWQQVATFGPKQMSRIWGNIVKQDEIIVKASTLAVGANKPIRSTKGWESYGGSIFKVGHGLRLDENDLLSMQELSANDSQRLATLMMDSMFVKSDNLIIGIHNKMTSWVYKALSTGVVIDSDVDGIAIAADMRVPQDRKIKTIASWFDNSTGAPLTTYSGNDVDPIQNLIDIQQWADDNNVPYDHWKITKKMYRKFWQHPAVVEKCRAHINNLVNTRLILTESEVMGQVHALGVAPFLIVDEKSAKEIDGVAQVDTDSFESKNLVLCQSGTNLMEVKNARSVYEERVMAGPTAATAQYSFVGENNAIAVLNEWKERPIQNIFEAELWAFPIFRNPKNVIIFSTDAQYVWPTVD